ncbi:glycosyltransferase family 2 protein [Leifsonia sp. YAF41]|uniref:glycosyltransferase n=1 Tax=Leifsonia sp. YAF41 TaxID=3233086 RepID=UPI003F97D57A
MEEVAAAATIDATIVIPTLNGEPYLGAILDALKAQDFTGEYEVLVIDSGSSDGTMDIVRARPWVRLHEIPNEEFGHGTTRNLGARLARGRMIAYLTQDAVPSNAQWLTEITAPLDPQGLDAVAVMGKQIPRRQCFPLLKYEIFGVFARFGSDLGTTVFSRGEGERTPQQLYELSFYSDVNSATRRDFLLNVIPYQDLPYSEDFAFGRDVIEAGYRKAYAPQACVEHSNDMTLREYGKRIFDETISRRRVGHDVRKIGRGRQVLYTGYGVLRDSARILRDRDYSIRRKLYWLVVNPAFHAVKWQSYYRSLRTGLDDHAAIEAGSLEREKLRSVRRDVA